VLQTVEKRKRAGGRKNRVQDCGFLQTWISPLKRLKTLLIHVLSRWLN